VTATEFLRRPTRSLVLSLALVALAALWLPPGSFAQVAAPLPTGDQLQGFGQVLPDLKAKPDEVVVSAQILPAEGKQPVRLSITATVKKGWHIYSITQGPGGGKPAEILLDRSKQAALAKNFAATPAPKRYFDDVFKAIVETHEGTVVWTAPLKLADGVDPSKLKLTGKVDLQACDENACIPLVVPFTAELVKTKDADK